MATGLHRDRLRSASLSRPSASSNIMATRASDCIVTFQRGTTEFDIDIIDQHLTAEQLGRMFGVQPSSLWLSADNRAYFSNADGTLNLGGVMPFTTFAVQGSPASVESQQLSTPTLQTPTTLSATAAPTSGNRSPWSGFTSVVSTNPSRARAPGYPLKVVQARILRFEGGKPIFERIGQTFVNISEATANLTHVLTAAPCFT